MRIDMTGRLCLVCMQAGFKETNLQDDLKGVLHCPKCGNETERYFELEENLDKQEFWNNLHHYYKDNVDAFCKWIDEYKIKVKWNELIGKHVKFHDLPFEMQVGIVVRFLDETGIIIGKPGIFHVRYLKTGLLKWAAGQTITKL